MQHNNKIDQPIVFRTICESCGYVFYVNNRNTTYMHKVTIDNNGEAFDHYVTFYECNKCNRLHFVQIDNAETLSQLEQIKALIAENGKTYKESKKAKNSIQIQKIQKVLQETRRTLMATNSGKEVHVTTQTLETTVALNFSILDHIE